MNKVIGYVASGVAILAVVIGLIIGVNCICKVPNGYTAIIYSMKGGVQDQTLSAGWHMIAPTKHSSLFTISNEQMLLTADSRDGSKEDESFKVPTSDNATIGVSFQMTYRFLPDKIVDTYKSYRLNGETIVNTRVRTVLKSTVSEVTTNYPLMDLYSGDRASINEKITEYLNDKFSKQYGLEVIDASIIDVHPDKKLQTAIDNRIQAQQAADQAKAEQKTAKVKAETKRIKAENDAEIKKIEAQAEADVKEIEAKAEADANREIAKSITEQLIENKKIDKWDGSLPKVSGDQNSIIKLD